MRRSAARLRLIRTTYYVPPAVMRLWDRSNSRYGVRRGEGNPLYRWLVSPRLKPRIPTMGTPVGRGIPRQALARSLRDGLRTRKAGGGLLVVGQKES